MLIKNICIFSSLSISSAFLTAYGLTLLLEQFQPAASQRLARPFDRYFFTSWKKPCRKSRILNTIVSVCLLGFFLPIISLLSILASLPSSVVVEVFCLVVVNQKSE